MSIAPPGELSRHSLDLIVIGGGIIGGAVARDAALRGLRVALVEQDDFGAGTSATSTRLIHGGLRYLAQLDFGLVRQDLAEREVLLRLAPHLVRPLPFLVPIYRRGRGYRLKLRAGMLLYDLLSYDRSLPPHRMLSADATRQHEPGLALDGLEGAALYYDAQVALAERLCLEQVVAAAAAGATILNHTRVVGFPRDPVGAIRGVALRDQTTGRAWELRAPVVVNATGPWLDEVLQLATPGQAPLLRRTQGIHLVAPSVSRHALVLFAGADERLFFIIPWLGFAFVGTTDTDFDGDPAVARASGEDVDYLLREVTRVFPTAPWHPISYTTAGVRALVRRDGVATGAVSRKHRLLDHAERGLPGLISIVGGKLTAHRGIAEEAVDLVCRRLHIGAPSRTRQRALPGAVGYGPGLIERARREGLALGLAADQAEHLVTIYGGRYTEVLDLIADQPRLAGRIDPTAPDCLAQIHHAARREWAGGLADVLLRRTTLGLTAGQGMAAVEVAAGELAVALGQDDRFAATEASAYRAIVARMRAPVADRQ